MTTETPKLDLGSAILVLTIVNFRYPVTDHSDAGRFFDRWGCRGYRECNMGDTPAEVRGFACIGSSYLDKVPRESLLGVCPREPLDNKRL